MKAQDTISITSIDTISALGKTEDSWSAYQDPNHSLTELKFSGNQVYAGVINPEVKEKILELREENPNYKRLDESVLYAIWTSRNAVLRAGWDKGDTFGINIGSSRGATALFEKYYRKFIENKAVSSVASPTTTLGNISSWVAQDLATKGPELSHSITCSTALHGILNGIAWLNAGFSSKFLVGGSEAPLTPFTFAQMQALKIYSRSTDTYPCRALDMNKTSNGMVLGEGAAMICMERGMKSNALGLISSMGYATESLKHAASLSGDGICLQRSMEMALKHEDKSSIDAVIMHAPGTKIGDESEYRAIQTVFGDCIPALTTNKWKIGHTLGASGMMSLELALLMMKNQQFVEVPYIDSGVIPTKLEKVLVNAVGFGGNAVSVLLRKPD